MTATGAPVRAGLLLAPVRTVLVDDSAADREHFGALIAKHPAVHLVGEAETFKDGLGLLFRENAELLVLESRLGEMSILEDCALIPSHVKILFLTQDPSVAWKAYELDAVDFLLKPLTSERLAETVRRLLRLDWARQPDPAMRTSPQETALIPFERGRRGVRIEDILMIQAFGNYTRLSLSDGRSEIVLRSLSKWENLLPMPPFLRVHRNTIVNRAKIISLDQGRSSSFVRLTGMDEAVPVSRRCLADVRKAVFAQDR